MEPEIKPEGVAKSNNNLLIPASIIVAGALIAGSIYVSNNQRPVAATAGIQNLQPQVAQTADISKVKINGEPFIGNQNAPVTIAYWFDYQCPFCKKTEKEVMPQLIADYVKTGKVKLVYKDFQFLGEDSQSAGLVARAVWETAPDKFYEWHTAMYDKQDNENSGWGNKADILALTKTIDGIDAAKVDRLMNEKTSEYQKDMETDKAEGAAMGVNGTPAFVMGKHLLSGAQPYSAFKQVVELTLQGK